MTTDAEFLKDLANTIVLCGDTEDAPARLRAIADHIEAMEKALTKIVEVTDTSTEANRIARTALASKGASQWSLPHTQISRPCLAVSSLIVHGYHQVNGTSTEGST